VPGITPNGKILSGFDYDLDLLHAALANTYLETVSRRADSIHLAIKQVSGANIYWEYLKTVELLATRFHLDEKDVILAFDNPIYGWCPTQSDASLRSFPNMQHYLLANSVVYKHITYDGDKRNGWFWSVRYAQGLLKNFPNIKYVYVTNGDCICEKPEGFKNVIELLGDGDVIAGQSSDSKLHTADVFFKAEAFHRLFEHMAEIMRVPVIGSHNPEGMMFSSICDLGLKIVHPPKQPKAPEDGSVDFYTRYNQDSTWKELLGYRNLFAELEEAANTGGEPLPLRYLDPYLDWLYFNGEERSTLCKYYATNDRRYLYQWWALGESSWYNRLYYPLEFYGEEPIYESGVGTTS